MTTNIEWVRNPDGTKGETWNPITGCSHAGGPGCDMCYARRMARRLAGRYGYPEAPYHFDVTLRPKRLEQPLRWKKPRMIFVCSMSDLFHEDVPEEYRWAIYGIIAHSPQHTFQILTKRPTEALAWYKFINSFHNPPTSKFEAACRHYGVDLWADMHAGVYSRRQGLSNVWLGTSIENQAAADERREHLRQCPAAVKFVSYEPALGPVDWTGWEFVSQIISGGESGPGARPSHPDWHRATRDFCQANGIAYFFKQHGAWLHESQFLKPDAVYHSRVAFKQVIYPMHVWPDNSTSYRVGKRAAGRLLDGRTWDEFPDRSEQ